MYKVILKVNTLLTLSALSVFKKETFILWAKWKKKNSLLRAKIGEIVL